MPGREQREATLARERFQYGHFAERRARRLLEHHVLAGFERGARLRVAHLRRRAQRHGVGFALGGQQRAQIAIVAHAGDFRVAARARGQLETRFGVDRRQMLVARNLADADDPSET